MRSTSVMKRSVAIAVCLSAACFANAEEQREPESAKPVLEEVYVTARRRDEDLQRTPVAVSVVSAEDLSAYNMKSIGDVTRNVPGLERFEGRKEADFAIRGIGRGRSTDNSLDPSVGVYIDGIFLPRHDSQLLDAVAVESVQVLRGPQGTLFGKNTIGGAILVTTKAPAEDFALSLTARSDSFNTLDTQLSVDVPLFQNRLLTRLTISKQESDGFAEDIDTGRKFGDKNRHIIVGRARAEISEHLQLDLLAHYSDQNERIEPYNCQFVNDDALTASGRTPGNPKTYKEACQDSEALFGREKISTENFGLGYGTDQFLVGASLKWELPVGELTSISTYSERGPSVINYEIDGTDVFLLLNQDYAVEVLRSQDLVEGEVGTRWGWSQEFQLSGDLFDSKVRYTAGLFASRESMDKNAGGNFVTKEGYVGLERIPGVADAPPGTLFVAGAALGGISSRDNTSYAAFGQATVDLTTSLQFTVGARYTEETRDLKTADWNLANSTPPAAPLVPSIPGVPVAVMTEAQFDALAGTTPELVLEPTVQDSLTFDNVSAMASLAWNVTDSYQLSGVSNLMTYMTVSEGFKAGGFTSFFGELATFKPETLLSTEIGAKMDLFDQRLRLNIAAYDSDYTDMQMFVVRIDGQLGGDFGTTNAGKARIRGAEIESIWLISQGFSVIASTSYNKAEFQEYDDFAVNLITGDLQAIDRSNEPFPFIPEWTHSLSLQYRLSTKSLGDFDFIALTSYRDRIFMGQDYKAGVPQFIDMATADSYTTTGVRVSWSPMADQSLRISLFGNNVFDKEYVAWGVAVTDNLGSNGVIRGTPMHWGMELKYELGRP